MRRADRQPGPGLGAWNRLGLAFWRTSGGSEAGFEAFDTVSRKSAKHDPAATRARWAHFATSPPDRIGVGTLVWEARRADPAFHKRRPDAAALAAADDEPAPDDWQAKLDAAIDELNEIYFVARMGGKG